MRYLSLLVASAAAVLSITSVASASERPIPGRPETFTPVRSPYLDADRAPGERRKPHLSDLLDISLAAFDEAKDVWTTNTGVHYYEQFGNTPEGLEQLRTLIHENGDNCLRLRLLAGPFQLGHDNRTYRPNHHIFALYAMPWCNEKTSHPAGLSKCVRDELDRCGDLLDFGQDFLGWGSETPLVVFASDRRDPAIVRLRLGAQVKRQIEQGLAAPHQGTFPDVLHFTRERCDDVLRDRGDVNGSYAMRVYKGLFYEFQSSLSPDPPSHHVPEGFNEGLVYARERACATTWPWFKDNPSARVASR